MSDLDIAALDPEVRAALQVLVRHGWRVFESTGYGRLIGDGILHQLPWRPPGHRNEAEHYVQITAQRPWAVAQ